MALMAQVLGVPKVHRTPQVPDARKDAGGIPV
jgi:hypothetical protein